MMLKPLKYIAIGILWLGLFSCEKQETPNEYPYGDIVSITVLHTSDEHGWFEATEYHSGASGMMGHWQNEFGYNNADSFLILSSGDMWTGPAMSTWFQGKSMVDVMNTMEYDAAALGNHEFDFTADTLLQRSKEMNFPILAANISPKNSENEVLFSRPYIIKQVGGLNIGIIGLASTSTPFTAFPEYVKDYNFTDYGEAIEKYGAELTSLGSDFNIILGHFCQDEFMELIPLAKKYKVALILGGHCHRIRNGSQSHVYYAESGSNFSGCSRIRINYSMDGDSVYSIYVNYHENNLGYSSPQLTQVINYWEELASESLNEVIGYIDATIPQSSVEMENMVTDSWLWAIPDSDVALTNTGGIRQSLYPENIRIADVIGLLPFENNIYKLELTGAQLKNCLNNFARAGINTSNGYVMDDNTPLDENKTYNVLTTDYLYTQDNYLFKSYDPDPINTYMNYRDPLISWIKSLNTNSNNPLNNYLDYTPRR